MTGFSELSLQLFSNHTNPIHLAALGILSQSKEGGAWLPRDLEHLVFKFFNQLLIPQIMGLLGPKAI